MLQPSRRKYRKEQKGRNTGLATRGAKVSFGDDLVVDDGERADACQNEVFGDLVGEGPHGDEEDVGTADLFLGFHAPEANLSVIEGNLIWGTRQ